MSIKKKILLHVIVRFPWRRDIRALSRNNVNMLAAIPLMTLTSALSRNNAAVHGYISLVTQQ
jgi:hypothetical protein